MIHAAGVAEGCHKWKALVLMVEKPFVSHPKCGHHDHLRDTPERGKTFRVVMCQRGLHMKRHPRVGEEHVVPDGAVGVTDDDKMKHIAVNTGTRVRVGDGSP